MKETQEFELVDFKVFSLWCAGWEQSYLSLLRYSPHYPPSQVFALVPFPLHSCCDSTSTGIWIRKLYR